MLAVGDNNVLVVDSLVDGKAVLDVIAHLHLGGVVILALTSGVTGLCDGIGILPTQVG